MATFPKPPNVTVVLSQALHGSFAFRDLPEELIDLAVDALEEVAPFKRGDAVVASGGAQKA